MIFFMLEFKNIAKNGIQQVAVFHFALNPAFRNHDVMFLHHPGNLYHRLPFECIIFDFSIKCSQSL